MYPETFEYRKGGDGSRGVFDWNFIYRWLPRRPRDMIEPDQPFPLPIMLGCAFVIMFILSKDEVFTTIVSGYQ